MKCKAKYESEDPDPFYCPPCDEVRKEIAKDVDKKMVGVATKRPVKSDLQVYDEIRKAKGTPFVSIKDLGITL